MKMVMSSASEVATSAADRHGFQTPVGALISSKVWQKEARYRAFFSCTDNLRQSPFSFSRSTCVQQTNNTNISKDEGLWPVESAHQDLGRVLLEADGRHRVVDAVHVDGQTVDAVANDLTLADLVGVGEGARAHWSLSHQLLQCLGHNVLSHYERCVLVVLNSTRETDKNIYIYKCKVSPELM